MILDKDGNIAVRYRESLPKGISGPSGRDYLFQVKGMVSLCYIHPSDWPWFSRFRGGGCCGHGGPVMFWEAGARDVEIWSA